MRKLKIEKSSKANDTVTRTIRISGKTFDKINELAEKAHSNAVKHGFWDKKFNNEHYLMLVITEIAEMV